MQLAIEAAEAQGVEHLVVNQRHAADWDLRLETCATGLDGALVVGGAEHALATITGVYVRLTSPDELPEVRGYGRRPPDPRIAARVHAFHTLLGAWLEATRCRVANRASAGGSNISKPYQAQLIASVGLDVPDTLITNDPEVVARYASSGRQVVFKSTSGIRSIVRPLDAHRMAQLHKVRALPTQFQHRVQGSDVRVHVVGDAVFATEVTSEAVDYRYAGRDGLEATFLEAELPDEVADACRRLSRELELPFCGIDLRRGPTGRYTCFEVNPSPGYSYYQSQTGQQIAAALVDWLAG